MKQSFNGYPLTKIVLVSTIFYILLSLVKVVGGFTDTAGFWLCILIYILYRVESY